MFHFPLTMLVDTQHRTLHPLPYPFVCLNFSCSLLLFSYTLFYCNYLTTLKHTTIMHPIHNHPRLLHDQRHLKVSLHVRNWNALDLVSLQSPQHLSINSHNINHPPLQQPQLLLLLGLLLSTLTRATRYLMNTKHTSNNTTKSHPPT